MSPAPDIRLGTRGSQLALWQAHTVAARIADTGGPPCRIVTIKTSGDRLQDAPLSDIGGKRLFVKEIEDALLRHDIDIAVHSSKDMPAVLPEGLAIAAVLAREDPRDAVVLPARPSGTHPRAEGVGLGAEEGIHNIEQLIRTLGPTPSIGTGSVRRIAQLIRLIPGARFAPIRGNLDTRLRKLDAGGYDALVLAAAGLRRLGFGSRVSFALPVDACVPAPGQGIVAIEIRVEDVERRRIVSRIDDPAAGAALAAERALVEALGGGCQTPIGALAMPAGNDDIELVATVIALDGSRMVGARERGPRQDAAAIGGRVAQQLVAAGADEILAASHTAQGRAEKIQP